MSLLEVFPEYLLRREEEEAFLAAVRILPIEDMRKKQILIEWTKLVGVVLTEEMINAVVTQPREV